MTPRLLLVVFEASADRRKREHESLAWAAWHTAYWTAYAPRKSTDFIPFADVIGAEKSAPPVQTPEQMKAVFAAMRGEHGG